MSQHTGVHSKKEFIKMLQDNMKEDDVIVWTQNGTLFEYKKKYKQKNVTFGFAADVFESKDGVGDIIRSTRMGIVICKRDILSAEAKELVPVDKPKRLKNEPRKK